jgi:CRP-like cAMP-binding protein
MEQQEIVWSLVKFLKKVKLEADTEIYQRTEIPDGMYIIHKGKVKLFIENGNGL